MELIFVKTLILFITSFIMLRLMGKRQLGELEPFEVVITIMIAEVAAAPLENPTAPVLYGVIPIITLYIIHTFLSHLALKQPGIRKIICGKETMVIKNGCILIENMRKNDYSMDELNEQLREKGIFNIEEVSFAIIESGGTLSVLKKTEYEQPTKKDLKIPCIPAPMPCVIITCGKFQKDCRFNKKRFADIAKANGFSDIEKIFYASLSSNKKLFIQDFSNKISIIDLGEEDAS